MMINNQQIGSFPFEMLDHNRGFSSQQQQQQQSVLLAMEGGTTSQSLRTVALSDISSSDFESFPGFEQYDQSIPCWPQALEICSSVYENHRPLEVADSEQETFVTFQSRDTLQSLVQSSSCSNQNPQSFEENFEHQISHLPEGKKPALNKFRDWSHYHNINFQTGNEAKDDYSQGLISPILTNTSKRAAMAKRSRIRWTQELHNQFIQCVNRLGGARKATPKGILKLMNCDGLTIFHIKSHLQKYRVAQYIPVPEAKEEEVENTEKTWRSSTPELDPEMGMKILEALKMQIDVQRRLYEQLECQNDLQSRIEEQAQQLKKMFDRQLETNTNPRNNTFSPSI